MESNVYTVRKFQSLNGDVYSCDQLKNRLGLILQEESKQRIESVTGFKVKGVEWWPADRIHVIFHDSDKALVCIQKYD